MFLCYVSKVIYTPLCSMVQNITHMVIKNISVAYHTTDTDRMVFGVI